MYTQYIFTMNNQAIKIIRRTAFTLYAILIIVMAAATIVEDQCGTETAHATIYEAWWFYTLWCAALALSLTCITPHFRWIKRLQRRWSRKKQKRASQHDNHEAQRHAALAATILAAMCALSANAMKVRTVALSEADSLKSTQVMYLGRLCPLNTPARDFALKVTGSTSFGGLTPEQLMLSWALYPEDWKDVAMIKVRKAAAQQALGIKTSYARFTDCFNERGQYILPQGKYTDLEDQLSTIILLSRGQLYETLSPGAKPLSDTRVNAEMAYNATPWNLILFIGCFSLAFMLFAITTRREKHHMAASKAKIFHHATLIARIALFAFLLTSLCIRWYISEHLPLTSTYETMQVVALAALAISCFTTKHAMPALLVAGATLLVTHISSLDPQVTPIMPVLQSPWLSSHVTLIMVSYCLYALLLFTQKRSILIWAEVLLGIGIILGGIWAKTAWGAFWQWDPKETWALITLLVYMYPLHSATLPWFRNKKHLALYLRLAFLTVLMTYFGCNYLLTGLHSYAN